MVQSLSSAFPAFFPFHFLFSCFLFTGFCNFTLSSMSKSWLRLVVLKMEPSTFVHQEINSKFYNWKNIPGRLFRGGSEALWGRAVLQISKTRFGNCVGRLPFLPPQTYIKAQLTTLPPLNELRYFIFPILKLKKIKRKNIGINFCVCVSALFNQMF